jgi:hypothetical protein
MINFQTPHAQTQLDHSLALLGFCQKQWIRWAEISLSHHRLGMITAQEKLTQITQSKDPFRAQLTGMQMASEQLSNNIQWLRHLWASSFESQSQWNQTWLHLTQAQQQVANEAIQFQWLAAQPTSEYANAMAESVMAASRHFVNGAGTHP